MSRNHVLLGSIAGIPIGVHITTLWLLGLIGVFSGVPMLMLLLILAVVVLLHELGHALVAKRFGIHVISITLYPFGSMAHMSMIPERGREELLIALAGPATNLLLALPVLLLAGIPGFLNPELIGTATLTGLAWYWVLVNLALGLFNLLPAFPLDGGRVLSAALIPSMGFLQATERAVRVGRWLAAAMLAWAIFGPGSGWGLAFVAVFVWLMGGRELFAARLRHAMPGQGNPLEGFAQFFNQARQPFTEPPTGAPFAETEDAPRQADFTDITPPAAKKGAGFSEDDIKRLETFHGRLPRKPRDEQA